MQNKNSKVEFMALLAFAAAAVLLLTNGFVERISAQETTPDVYQKMEPVADVLWKILDEYVDDADMEKIVEGALMGMMNSLDRNSSFIPAKALENMREDTRGEFEGIGVSIKENPEGQVYVVNALNASPAKQAGLRSLDTIIKVDDIPVEQLKKRDGGDPRMQLLLAVTDKIRGRRGSRVKITVSRKVKGEAEPEILDFVVKRARVPLESIKEARILEGGIGYVRISDFKDNTARDLRLRLNEFLNRGMTAFVLDLRWNPGGLLSASREVSELFLPKRSLVTYTKGRAGADGKPNSGDMELFTETQPVVPPGFPIIVLVNESTASSSEIVTGALQYYKRALIVGEKTFGKGSVQTIIPLRRPVDTALRLTTALYYTPADVTINNNGILPDVEAATSDAQDRLLMLQMFRSFETDYEKVNLQNHGSVTGSPATLTDPREMRETWSAFQSSTAPLTDDEFDFTVEDEQLKRAVEILREEMIWDDLVAKYHRAVAETQVAGTFGGRAIGNGRAHDDPVPSLPGALVEPAEPAPAP